MGGSGASLGRRRSGGAAGRFDDGRIVAGTSSMIGREYSSPEAIVSTLEASDYDVISTSTTPLGRDTTGTIAVMDATASDGVVTAISWSGNASDGYRVTRTRNYDEDEY